MHVSMKMDGARRQGTEGKACLKFSLPLRKDEGRVAGYLREHNSRQLQALEANEHRAQSLARLRRSQSQHCMKGLGMGIAHITRKEHAS